jgi:hypothetical protein
MPVIAVWFFTDEAEQLYLPYHTSEEAERAATIYAQMLTTGWEGLSPEDQAAWGELHRNNKDLCEQIRMAVT